ncbi:SRPBCC domain-containing protein [Nocardiopsis sp. EMB25]|uniref:SRPBCC domain-containing protein n=1 Tax=Nocardiopsis TaxID=2013 RepID=UPI00034D861E|nr:MULTISPECIES: SRPBCC domain-containing protein [Nocardiopsis]MCY9783895.1 SRPBCC domain-containing protein [Nocardiopsis sp. EMB25]
MHVIETRQSIDAAPERVWEALAALGRYREWNPVIVEADGAAAVGERIAFRMVLPGGGQSRHEPVITVAEPGRALCWEGTVGAAWLARAVHEFRLAPSGDGTVLIHRETFTGLLVPLVKGTLKRTEEGFVEMNRALKKLVESGAAAE